MVAHFLNADMDIFSTHPLDSLAHEIGDRAILRHCGPCSEDKPFMARYEIDHDLDNKNPELLILAFCRLIESLSPDIRTLWDSADSRVIDLGYEISADQNRMEDSIAPDTLRQMAALGIRLAWTFYPPDNIPVAHAKVTKRSSRKMTLQKKKERILKA